MTATLEEAKALAGIVRASDSLFVLTHNYTGYAMLRQMREMIAEGAIGKLRHVQAEYAQDWLTEAVEKPAQKVRNGAPTPAAPVRAAPSAISALTPSTLLPL